MKPTLRTIISVALFTMLTIASLNFFRAFDSEAAQVSPIPREAISRYTGIISKVHPSVRSWINEEAARIKSKGDVTSIYSSINSRFGAQLKAMNAGSGDIEAVAFVVLMQATKDMDDDLKM